MNLEQITKYIEEQFVDDYEDISKFMVNVNNTLDKIGISEKYKSYNDFCIDIKENIFEMISKSKDTELSSTLVTTALNNMVKYKIIKDLEYENKIKNYYSNSDIILEDINQLKIKNLSGKTN